MSPFDAFGESISSPFQALKALPAASCTCIILCLAACCKAYGICSSINFSLSANGIIFATFYMILQTLTLHI
jgi:hypothetical protein